MIDSSLRERTPSEPVARMSPFRLPARALFVTLTLCALGGAQAAPADRPIVVTPDNFARAESDLIFSGIVKDGGFGKFMHRREPTPLARQTVIRMNRDTLYSAAVFDLDAGPVAITLPDPGKRFLSMQVIDEDEYTPEVVYGAGVHTLSEDRIGGRYVVAAVRILVDPNDPKDIETVRALQDAIKVSQPGGPGTIPNWDASSQIKVRDALLDLAQTVPDTKGMFGILKAPGPPGLADLDRVLQRADGFDVLRIVRLVENAHREYDVSSANPILAQRMDAGPVDDLGRVLALSITCIDRKRLPGSGSVNPATGPASRSITAAE